MHMQFGECTNVTCTHACPTHAACKVQACLMHAHHKHSICTLHASCKHMIITLCASHTHAGCTWDAHFTNATSMLHVPHMHAYEGCLHAAHTPLHMSYTHCMLVTFTLHTPNMPYTCHKPVLCMLHMHCILATCLPRLNTFPMHTFMLAQAYYMQERHKLAAHTL